MRTSNLALGNVWRAVFHLGLNSNLTQRGEEISRGDVKPPIGPRLGGQFYAKPWEGGFITCCNRDCWESTSWPRPTLSYCWVA